MGTNKRYFIVIVSRAINNHSLLSTLTIITDGSYVNAKDTLDYCVGKFDLPREIFGIINIMEVTEQDINDFNKI